MNEKDKLDLIIPISIDLDWPTVPQVIAEIREQHREYGISQFALACPGGGWRYAGFPPEEFYREKAEFFRSVKEAVSPEGIECGWWITLTVKSGPDPRWNRMIRMNGTETPMASCPLNPVFREVFSRNTALFVRIAAPSFVITEDDFSINAATQGEGCFCEHHLAEFARREGRSYSREELKEILEQTTPEAHALRRRWRALMRDSLAGFAAAIREAVDKENPEVPIGTMQSGAWDRDGDATEAVTRAIAGKNHEPFCRLYGTFYGGEHIPDAPARLFHSLYTRQHIGKNFRCYHESDTFPHTRFFTSAACMRIFLGCGYSYGFAGSTFQTQQLLDDANEEKIYCKLLKEERPRFQAISDKAKLCRLKGVRIHFDPFMVTAEKGHAPSWCNVLSLMSIPYTTLASPVTFLSGAQTAGLSDEEIRELLAHALFLDGEAADHLCRRGYAAEIGVMTGNDPAVGMDRFDLAGREIIEPGFAPESRGRHMHRAEFYSPGGNGVQYSLTPVDPRCEVITRTVAYDHKNLSIGMSRFVNRFGGKVVVISQGVNGNHSSSLFNYRRQKLFHEQLKWCCDEFVFVKDEARVFLIQNEALAPEEAGFSGMLTLTNLNPDPLEGFSLHLPPAWRNRAFLRLDRSGNFVPCPAEETTDGVRFGFTMSYAYPEILIVR